MGRLATSFRAIASMAICACCGLLAGCHDRQQPADGMPAGFAQGEGALAWEGARRCADCDGIESQLTLRWSADVRAYTLVETYRAREGALRFEDAGDWRHRGELILLEGSGGERRAYRLLDDGRLHGRNVDGSALAGRTEEMLLPMGASHEP